MTGEINRTEDNNDNTAVRNDASGKAVTVIIPAYNCGDYIREAVRSVLSQEIGVRVLLIDDASPEDVKGPVRDMIAGGRIEYYRNEVNMGVAETRNRGIDMADTQYIAFLDGDDFWLPGKLSAELSLIEEKKAPLVFTARELYTFDGIATGKTIYAPEEMDYDSLLLSNRIPLGSVLMRTDIAKEFKFKRPDLHEDYILWLEVTKKYGKVYGINVPYLACRQSKGGKSRNKLRSARMHYETLIYMGIPKREAAKLMASYTRAGFGKYIGKDSDENRY